jgi:uroporphyrinogen-III synthase
VANFYDLVDVPALLKKFPQLRLVSIGPQTSQALQARGLSVTAEASVHTIPGLVDAVLKLCR